MHELTGVWYSDDYQALVQLHKQGIFMLGDFEDAIQSILELTIEECMSSDNPLTRAFAFFDRRLGKRRLEKISLSEDEFAVIKEFYRIRCEAEEISKRMR